MAQDVPFSAFLRPTPNFIFYFHRKMSGKSAFPAFPASIPSSPWEEVLSVILWPRNPSFPFPTHRRFPPPQKKDRESIFMGHLNPGRNGKLSAAAVKKRSVPSRKRANEKTRLCRHSWIQDCRKSASHSNTNRFYFSARLILDEENWNQPSPLVIRRCGHFPSGQSLECDKRGRKRETGYCWHRS